MKINWIAPIDDSGYGVFSANLLLALKKLNVDLVLFPSSMKGAQTQNPEIVGILANPIDADILNADASVRMSIANPFDICNFHGKKRIFYTLLEVDRIPPYWVRALNTVDEVWTTSEWGKQTFIDSGVKTNIEVMPGGVNLNIFNPHREPLFPKGDKFRFLFVGKWQIRKGVDILCRAFAEEFSANENVELLLVCDSIRFHVPDYNIYNALFNLKLDANRPDIKIVDGIIENHQDMGRCYTSADCFVNPTRGEGWNLPLIEAMASGLPCITTNWSAHTEYANKKNCILLNEYKLVKAEHPLELNREFYKFGRWAEPSIKELKMKMRQVFESRYKITPDMREWTWDKAAEKIKKRLEEIVDGN